MKWLIACMLVLCMAVPAFAGEDVFVSFVKDSVALHDANLLFYLSPKERQFLIDKSVIFDNTTMPAETFTTDHPIPKFPELCDLSGKVGGGTASLPFTFTGVESRMIPNQNGGKFTWTIIVPKKPNALNICFECAVVKPNAFAELGFDAVEQCAANTGEILAPAFCTRLHVLAGSNPIDVRALPTIKATANPGPDNGFTPFQLTAYRNPSTYNGVGQPLVDGIGIQILDGGPQTKIMLKSCLEKCINIKIPVDGQLNSINQTENALEVGDTITIEMFVPSGPWSLYDLYCGQYSASLKGVGESIWPVNVQP